MSRFAPALALLALTITSVRAQNLTLAGIVAATPELSTLGAAVEKANLTHALADPTADYTVFAPPNSAFEGLDEDLLNLLLTDEYYLHLQNVLRYHVVGDKALSTDLTDGQVLDMLNNETVEVGINGSTVSLANSEGPNAVVVTPDIEASNGVAHVVDNVLVPSFIYRTLADLPDEYSTVVKLAVDAGLGTELKKAAASKTLLAPNNAAFEALGQETLDRLTDPDNVEELQEILLYHVIDTVITSDLVTDGAMVDTLNGASVTASVAEDGTIKINEAEVILANYLANNGITHGIDAVLLPPGDGPTPPMTSAGATFGGSFLCVGIAGLLAMAF